jgi:diguanylate cyclase (GGDEF)-like protein
MTTITTRQPAAPARSRFTIAQALLSLLVWVCASASAQPIDLPGQWFELGSSPDGPRRAVDHVSAIGGTFEFEADLRIARAGPQVIDFKNSSVIDRFSHRIFDERGKLIVELAGGIGSDEPNPHFLRHGRDLDLPPGRYKLVSRLESPFFLAKPEPYLDTLSHYRQSTKTGNALVLVCLGVFLGLGAYYAVLAGVRKRLVHAMYALFILGNLLYNATALLVVRELFGVGVFYLSSAPILFSNIAYVVFVVALLDLRPESTPRLWAASRIVIAALLVFLVAAVLQPHWSMELCRYGVGLFLAFGLSAGIAQTLRGNPLARWYLIANIGFFVSGVSAISMLSIQGVYTLYIEHLGLVAVTIEVLLLALVLSYQWGLLQNEKVNALANAEKNLRLACTDALTGLPNRYALEIDMVSLPAEGSLTFIDLDGLKYYNDRFGHDRGDQLLRDFASGLTQRLGDIGVLHRLGGDEFAVTATAGEIDRVERMLEVTMENLRHSGYELSGASCGSVRVYECSSREQLKRTADARMYENKNQRRAAASQPQALEVDPDPV